MLVNPRGYPTTLPDLHARHVYSCTAVQPEAHPIYGGVYPCQSQSIAHVPYDILRRGDFAVPRHQ
eukprot:9217721-Pyramimonas_sp.AAC.1